MIHAEFLQEVEHFLAEHSMSATRFGILALNDREFVRRLRRGGDVRVSTIERVRGFMSEEIKRAKSEAAA